MDPTLIIFIVLAGFLSYRLFAVLGTRGGHEPDEADRYRPTPPSDHDPSPDVPATIVDRDPRPVPAWVARVQAHYPDFEEKSFVSGAKSAYEMIVQAFAGGNLDEIRPYVDPTVMKAFEVAVEGRRNAGQTMEVTFVGVEKAEVLNAEERSNHIEVVVAFQSDQIRVMRDAQGEIVDGDPNRIDLVKDRWTFSRPTDSRDPNWTLTATDGAAPTAG